MTVPRVTADDLAGLRRLLAEATERPWSAAVGKGPKRRKQQHAVIGRANMRGQGEAGAIAVFASIDGRKADNAELAVAAVNALPWLLEQADRAESAERDLAAAQTQITAVRAVLDERERYIARSEPDSLPVVWITKIRAALAEGPAPEETT